MGITAAMPTGCGMDIVMKELPEEAVEFDFLQDSEERNAAYVREMECFVDMALGKVANINDLHHANKILDFLMNRSGGGYENAER